MTQDRAEVLDHNARLYFELDPSGAGTNLYSFFSEYQDYLDERNMIDVSDEIAYFRGTNSLYHFCSVA